METPGGAVGATAETPEERCERVAEERDVWRRRARIGFVFLGICAILGTFMGCRVATLPGSRSVAVATPLECRVSADGTQLFATIRLAALQPSYVNEVIVDDDVDRELAGQDVGSALILGDLRDLDELADTDVREILAGGEQADPAPFAFGDPGEEDGVLVVAIDLPDGASEGRAEGIRLRGSSGELASEQQIPLGIRFGPTQCELAVSRPFEGY